MIKSESFQSFAAGIPFAFLHQLARLTTPSTSGPLQHDLDVTRLMQDAFPSDGFSVEERTLQSRVREAAEAVASEDLRSSLKQYVIASLQAFIGAQHDNASVFNQRVVKLGQIIATFKTGEVLQSISLVQRGEMANGDVAASLSEHPDADGLRTALVAGGAHP